MSSRCLSRVNRLGVMLLTERSDFSHSSTKSRVRFRSVTKKRRTSFMVGTSPGVSTFETYSSFSASFSSRVITLVMREASFFAGLGGGGSLGLGPLVSTGIAAVGPWFSMSHGSFFSSKSSVGMLFILRAIMGGMPIMTAISAHFQLRSRSSRRAATSEKSTHRRYWPRSICSIHASFSSSMMRELMGRMALSNSWRLASFAVA